MFANASRIRIWILSQITNQYICVNLNESPSEQERAVGGIDDRSWRANVPQFALYAGGIDNVGHSLEHCPVDHMNFSPHLHDGQNLLEVIYLDSLSDGILLKIWDCDSVLFFPNEIHEIILLLEILALILLFLMVVEYPHVHIFALRPLDALDQVVGGQLFEDLVEQIGGELGSIGQILLGAGVLFDYRVDPSIAVGQYGGENAIDSLLLALHKRNILILSISVHIYRSRIMIDQSPWKICQLGHLRISWRVVKLTLRRTFTTAHSSSQTRNNFFFKITSLNYAEEGYGQCGLPPKKPLCYLADLDVCEQFANLLKDTLHENKGKVMNQMLNQFKSELLQGIPQPYFKYFYEENIKDHNLQQLMKLLLEVLYWAYKIKQPQFKAAMSGLEFALFDFYSKILKMPLTQFIFGNQAQEHECYSFYTLSYEENENAMIENALEFLEFTPYIKIKYIDNIPSLLALLTSLEVKSQGQIKGYIIDANASWTIESFQLLNQMASLQKYSALRAKVMYIEQPFPIQMQPHERKQWSSLKNGSIFKIMIDESFSSFEQVEGSVDFGHAVNIKSEKAGGPISCIRAAIEAAKFKMEVVFGSMVSTHLGCNQTYCLHPLTKWLDVDGSLLVQSPNLKGGFIWNSTSGLKQPVVQYFGVEVDTSSLN